jgi:hypothetical protein
MPRESAIYRGLYITMNALKGLLIMAIVIYVGVALKGIRAIKS